MSVAEAPSPGQRPARPWPARVATVLVTVAVLGPLYVSGGIALRGDMVFAPDQPWKPAGLGLDGSVPRAVPMDALVSLLDEALPGALLQRLLLTGALLAGGLGIARVTAGFRASAQVAAVVVYLWNPWVYERLAIGQWPMVLGYGLLPWLVLAAARAREGRPRGWPATALLLVGAAVCAPSAGLVATLLCVVVVATAGRARPVLAVLAAGTVANLPWIVPGVLGPAIDGTSAQFADFAARGESGLGAAASLLSMGGIWKSSIVPPERTHVVVVAVAALASVAFLVGFRYAVPVLGRRSAAGVAAGGGLSFALALLPAVGPVGDALGSLSESWPAVGVLRDSQRYLAPLGLVLAVGAAALVDRLVRAAGARAPGLRAVAGLLVAAPVLLLPSLAWGLGGAIRPVDYPADWDEVAAAVGDSGGATVVLPWTGSYRGYAWNDRRAVLDPAARLLPGDVLVDDRVFLRDHVLAGEDPFLARVGRAWGEPDPAATLRALGIRWVLVEHDNGVAPSDVPAGTVAFEGRWLTLVDLGRTTADLRPLRSAPTVWIVLAGDVAAGFVGCVSIWQLGRLSIRTRR